MSRKIIEILIDNVNNNIINSIYFIAHKTNFIHISKETIKNYIEDNCHKVIIIKDDEHIVGFLIYFLLLEEIDIIFIATYPHNYGYGKDLLSYLFKYSKNNNIKKITLDLHENNKLGKIFYTSNGFIQVAIRKLYYNNCFNAIIMEKEL